MSRIGPVRAVEVAPSAPRVETPTSAAAASAALRGGSSSSLAAKGFDVHALLDKMPQPRALAKGNGKGEGGGVGRSVGGSSGGGARGGAAGAGAEAVSVGLNVDAWVQFESFRGFDMALKVFQGRVLQKTGAELLCEYRLGADVTGYMTEERRKEREEARAREAEEVQRTGSGEGIGGGALRLDERNFVVAMYAPCCLGYCGLLSCASCPVAFGKLYLQRDFGVVVYLQHVDAVRMNAVFVRPVL